MNSRTPKERRGRARREKSTARWSRFVVEATITRYYGEISERDRREEQEWAEFAIAQFRTEDD